MKKSLVAALVAVLALVGLGYGAWAAFDHYRKRLTPEVCSVAIPGGGFVALSAEQARNAAIIVAASIERGLPSALRWSPGDRLPGVRAAQP